MYFYSNFKFLGWGEDMVDLKSGSDLGIEKNEEGQEWGSRIDGGTLK